jgi:hypothetical protein
VREIEIKTGTGWVAVSSELLADAEGLRQDIEDVLAGRPSRHGPPPSEPKPAAYDRLLAATDGLVREIVELHGPKPYKRGDGSAAWWQCEGCEFSGMEADPPQWPCETTGLIASRVGVDLKEANHVDQ